MDTGFMWKGIARVVFCASILSPASAFAVTFDWVTIGDPGNASDAPASNCYAASCGSVSDPYRIAKYEVTNAQYAEFLNAKAASDPLGLYDETSPQQTILRSGSDGSYTYSVLPGDANRPVILVSFFDALRFVNWLANGQGNGDTETGSYTLLGGTPTPSNGASVTRNPGATLFLPSENEWYKAAYYDGLSATYFDYPTGSDTATLCSAPTAAPNHAKCGDSTSWVGTVDVGSYTGSPSPYGTFDQGGNVWEWNEQIVGTDRGVRGGSWGSFDSSLLRASFRAATDPSTSDPGIGFRVASVVPEPGTALLLLGGLAGLGIGSRTCDRARSNSRSAR